MIRALAVFLHMCVAFSIAHAQTPAKEPPVPPGLSPGGVAIAVLGPGIDYRLPEFKGRLARDGEGDLIAWDFSDNDIRPFEPGGPGTNDAADLAALVPQAQLVIVKEKPGDPEAFGHMMTFVAKTPSRIVVWLDAAPERPDWKILGEAVRRFKDYLFIIPAGDAGEDLDNAPAFATLRGASNLLVVGSRTPDWRSNHGVATVSVTISSDRKTPRVTSRDGIILVAGLAARLMADHPKDSSADVRNKVIELGRGLTLPGK